MRKIFVPAHLFNKYEIGSTMEIKIYEDGEHVRSEFCEVCDATYCNDTCEFYIFTKLPHKVEEYAVEEKADA